MRLIDADALMEFARNQKSRSVDCNDIARFPRIDPDSLRPKGTWEWYDFTVSQRSIDRGYMCPVCAFKQEDETNFCPNCGADMTGDVHDV